MQPINLTCHEDRTEIAIAGVLDVSATADARAVLNEALTRALPLELQAEGLERADAGGLQLLLLFLRTARSRGLAFTWRSVGSALTTNAELLGLTNALELPR